MTGRELINRAKIFFANKNFSKAGDLLEKALAQGSDYADVRHMLGVISIENGELSKATEHLEKALKLNPDYTEALLHLSILYNDLGQHAATKNLIGRAKKSLSKTQKLDPFLKGKLANKHAEMGDLYKGLGLFSDAIAEYEKAVKMAPTFMDIRLKQALCERELGHKEKALSCLLSITKEKPQYLEAKIELGITYNGLGKKTEALKVWNEVAQKNPTHPLVALLGLTPSPSKAPALKKTKK